MYERVGRRGYVPAAEEIPSGVCECGCGGKTEIAQLTKRERREFKGHPKPHLPFHAGRHPKREDHWNWKGGRHRTSAGYIMRLAPEHPEADRDGYVWEHRLVMEQTLGRRLRPEEDVHHINGQKDDNSPENLVALTKGQHNAIHGPQRKYDSARMSATGKKGAAARWGKR